jgi:catechol 2,3-dioxygenase-like lactoylglutathione lyase family enzyme
MKQRLHVITLAVDDLERALAFYRDGLGFDSNGIIGTEWTDEQTGANGAIALFELEGGLILSLYPRRDLAKDAEIRIGPSQGGEFSLGHLVEQRNQVDELLQRAEAAGATVTPVATSSNHEVQRAVGMEPFMELSDPERPPECVSGRGQSRYA